MDCYEESLKRHKEWGGKIETKVRSPLNSQEELSLAYTPGVASSCLCIASDPKMAYSLTRKWNSVAVITDGSAVLGLGNIGPLAAMPVMEGKCALFKRFGGVDAIPICLSTQDSEQIISSIKAIAPSFGGINLEDIASPRCFEIEKALQEQLDIPVFHDDQHGTAIAVGAALLNALKLAKKRLEDVKIVINGPGAAGTAIAIFLLSLGARHILVCGLNGILSPDDPSLSPSALNLAQKTNPECQKGDLAKAMRGSDVFIGVSGPNCVTPEMVESMNGESIVFPLANPVPEISFEQAKLAGAYIVGTGSSAYPNQINNVLAFPGLFRGALDARAKRISERMQKAACLALSSYLEPSIDRILPSPLDEGVHKAVAKMVCEEAKREEKGD